MSARRCACGCGELVSGRARYVGPAHRQRAYRARRAARLGGRSVRASWLARLRTIEEATEEGSPVAVELSTQDVAELIALVEHAADGQAVLPLG